MNPEATHIALLMMVKNESKRILVSLESVLGIVDSFVIYDTGSEDNTIEIIENFCEKHKIPLHLKQGEFVDFSTSRNVSISFAEEFDEIDWLLLLDCNDELQEAQHLRGACLKLLQDPTKTAFHLCQVWKSSSIDKYWNTRLIRARTGWKYKGVVHEYMANTENKELLVHRLSGPILFQDRTKDDDKSLKRFFRDRVLLEKEYEKHPEDTRTMFYLAQTYGCLRMDKQAYDLYLKRSEYENYQEERFQAYFRAAKLADHSLDEPWEKCMSIYLKAYEVLPRAEPLIKIAEYYNKKKQWSLAYTFAKAACELEYPHSAILFVDKLVYDYTRWHLLGVVAFYCERYVEGNIGCIKAIEQGSHVETDKDNLKFYEDYNKFKFSELDNAIMKLRLDFESRQSQVTNKPSVEKMSKKDFFAKKTEELKTAHPNLTRKSINSKVTKEWKKYRDGKN